MIKRPAILIAAVLGASLALAGCETATPYQPMAPGNAVAGGFTDQKLDDSHARVMFQGNSVTSREQVETYLLYRSAEVTAAQGFDWFEMVQRHTRDTGETYVTPSFVGPYGGYWAPYWAYGRGGRGWGYWDPYRGGPFLGGYDVERIDRYKATAEIAMGHGPKPAANPRAFDARQVMANLGPKIVRPQ